MDEGLSTTKLSGPAAVCGTSISCNVPVNTALPPQVEGHLRCFLCLSIPKIKWVTSQHPKRTLVHITWWGETGPGTSFRPLDVSSKWDTNLKTTARYPIRSGPKQFSSYLNDMNVLVLDVVDEDSSVVVGYAEVTNITSLTVSHSLGSVYPVFSLEDKKIAELHVSLVLEPLMESYDSSGFVPTPDISNTQSTKFLKLPEMSPYSMLGSSLDQNCVSMKENLIISGGGNAAAAANCQQEDTTISITTAGDVVHTQNIPSTKSNFISGSRFGQSQSILNQQSGDHDSSELLSILLEKGNKLRKTMIHSMANEPSENWRQDDSNLNLSLPISRSSSCGSLLREILNVDNAAEGDPENSEQRVINLVLGPDHDNLDLNDLVNDSKSSISSLELDSSDVSDPLHEGDILQDLFYTNQMDTDLLCGSRVLSRSSSRSSLDEPGNKRPPSRRSSCTSESIEMTVEETVKPSIKPPKSSKTKSKSSVKSKPPLKPKPPSKSTPRTSPKAKKASPRVSRTSSKPKGSVRKLRRRSRSRSRSKSRKGNGSDVSDTDSVSTSHSESSKVSFDMVPSDVDEAEKENSTRERKSNALSIERLTLLGRATVAKVSVDVFYLMSQTRENSPDGRFSTSGKPPKPRLLSKKASSYFLEYQFPVVAAARDKHTPNTMATEVTRAVAKQVKENTVLFNHRSVFPILFDGKSIESWWKSAVNFKLYSRSQDQKTPTLIGCCQISLKSVLKADTLCVKKYLAVCKPGTHTRSGSSRHSSSSSFSQVGELKVTVEIGSDASDFASALSQTRLAEYSGKTKFVPIFSSSRKKSKDPPGHHKIETASSPREAGTSQNTTDFASSNSSDACRASQRMELITKVNNGPTAFYKPGCDRFQPMTNIHPTPLNSEQDLEALEPLALHSILVINEGRKISASVKCDNAFHKVQDEITPHGYDSSQPHVRNIYLLCRMFWCDQSVRSSVCWGTNDPQFDFVQVSPVLVTTTFLERIRNNYLVIEVWDKKTTAQNDELIGIVKLSLHQFYLSLRNKRIVSALLNAQYPIIAHDCFVPIVDPLTNFQYGQLKVLLAIGSVEQVSTLQRVTMERHMSAPTRTKQCRELGIIGLQDTEHNIDGELVEHLFEVVVEDISNMNHLEDMIWGEADCFVQYFFPSQLASQSGDTSAIEGERVTAMKTFRTVTTLCIPDPSFHAITKHKIILPHGIPVQAKLLNACVDADGQVSDIPFEVWCRFYHPNVRDQVIAKTSLPLVKLCAMVSMQKKEPLLQSFNLPLTLVTTEKPDNKQGNAGNLNITITYKSQTKQVTSHPTKGHGSAASTYISVGLLRICGLKAAAAFCASYNPTMQFPSEIGVNVYMKARLSFVDDRVCTTRTIARSFHPEVGQFFEFHCPLISTDKNSSCSLAEILETAELNVDVWHQVLEEIEPGSSLTKYRDVLVGVTVVPLIGLLTNKTGVNGWFPINKPVSESSERTFESNLTNQLECVVGGIEINVKFSHTNDKERVIQAAETVDWTMPDRYLLTNDFGDLSDGMSIKVMINIDEMNIAAKTCLYPGQSTPNKNSCFYIKYNFYDKGPFLSKYISLKPGGRDYLSMKAAHQNSFLLSLSSPLIWFLKEERLEAQVWLTTGSGSGQSYLGFDQQNDEEIPKPKDKLIGSVWIPLSGLCYGRQKKVHRISGLYPIFKVGAPDLHGMFLRAHISLQFQDAPDPVITTEEPISGDSDWNDSFLDKNNTDVINVFEAHISIERAMHLTHITNKNSGKVCKPNSYVSFQTAKRNKMASTCVMFSDDCPEWDYELDTLLSSQLLYEENKNLVFKVWHKPDNVTKDPDKSCDQVIGFLSVDLAPLVSGLKQLCGWYNIMDFGGRCRGQVKLSVIPLESMTHHWHRLSGHLLSSENLSSDIISLRKSPLPRFDEHYKNVKRHHELLQHQNQPSSEDTHSANSTTFHPPSVYHSDLKLKLKQQMLELEEMNCHLKSKLRQTHPSSVSHISDTASHTTDIQSVARRTEGQESLMASNFSNNAILPTSFQQNIDGFEHIGISDLNVPNHVKVDRICSSEVSVCMPPASHRYHSPVVGVMDTSAEFEDVMYHDVSHIAGDTQLRTEQPHTSVFSVDTIKHLPPPPPKYNEPKDDFYSPQFQSPIEIGSPESYNQESVEYPLLDSNLQIQEPIEPDFLDKEDDEVLTKQGKDGYDQADGKYDNDDDDYDDDDDDIEDEESLVVPRVMNDIPYISEIPAEEDIENEYLLAIKDMSPDQLDCLEYQNISLSVNSQNLADNSTENLFEVTKENDYTSPNFEGLSPVNVASKNEHTRNGENSNMEGHGLMQRETLSDRDACSGSVHDEPIDFHSVDNHPTFQHETRPPENAAMQYNPETTSQSNVPNQTEFHTREPIPSETLNDPYSEDNSVHSVSQTNPKKTTSKATVNPLAHTNFFLPLPYLEQSMRAVKLSTAINTYKSVMESLHPERNANKNEARRELVEKLSKPSTNHQTIAATKKISHRYQSLPTEDESQRIARIFSMKFK